jgi:hypothetical protein
MKVETEHDFKELRKHLDSWRKKFPMFKHDVYQIEHIVEKHIQNYSIIMVQYRQTKSRACIEKAQHEIDEINRVLELVGKMELMALLSQR